MNTMYNMSFWIWVQLSWFWNLCHSKLWYRRNNLHLYLSGNSLTWFCTFYLLFTQLEIKVSFIQANGSTSLLLLQITWIENSRNSSQMQQSTMSSSVIRGCNFIHCIEHSIQLIYIECSSTIQSIARSKVLLKWNKNNMTIECICFTLFSLSLVCYSFLFKFQFRSINCALFATTFFLFADFFHLYGNFTQEKICVFFMHCRVCLQIKFFPN